MPEHSNSGAAIRQIGTNAIPYLLGWISQAKPPRSSVYYPDDDYTLAMAAPDIFNMLGSDARPAVPALLGMLTNWQSSVSPIAGRALGRMGKIGIEPLIQGSMNPNANVRQCAIEGIMFAGTNGIAAIATLQHATNDSDVDIRSLAVKALNALEKR